MNEAVKLILSLTLSGSVLALLIFAIKPLIKDRVSKTFQYYIWLFVLLRLVFPFSLESSLMNNLFYTSDPNASSAVSTSNPDATAAAQIHNGMAQDESSGVSSLSVQQKVKNGSYNMDADHAAYLNDLFSQTALLIWLAGVFTALLFHICGFLFFMNRLRKVNSPATAEETQILGRQLDLLKLKYSGTRLFHNRFSTTPMLIGLFRPTIIIPDHYYTPKQLEGILRHELTHLRRKDIAVKWVTFIVMSLHWFNPLMLVIKREMGRACELSCDEQVIMDLSEEDRQVYGETLIDVVAERKYPAGVLSTTMCEEKKTLKARLSAIMNYHKNSKRAVMLAAVMFVVLFASAAVLGAGVGRTSSPGIGGRTDESTGTVTAIPNMRNVSVALAGAASGSLLSSTDYRLDEIVKHKTAYVGNNSKDIALVASLPLPDTFFIQQYISLKTKEEPYGLTVYYEAAAETEYPGEWPVSTIGSKLEINSKLNALVLFAMIDNVQDITFAYRGTKSTGDLEKDTYDLVYSFSRKEIEDGFGSLTVLAKDVDRLAEAIDDAAGKWSISISNPESVEQIAEKIDKLLFVIITPSASSNPGDYIRAHQTEYDEIIAMGKTALPYLKNILDSGEKGLRARIVEHLYQDIQN